MRATTPMAMGVSETIGANRSLTALATALIAPWLAPWVIGLLG